MPDLTVAGAAARAAASAAAVCISSCTYGVARSCEAKMRYPDVR